MVMSGESVTGDSMGVDDGSIMESSWRWKHHRRLVNKWYHDGLDPCRFNNRDDMPVGNHNGPNAGERVLIGRRLGMILMVMMVLVGVGFGITDTANAVESGDMFGRVVTAVNAQQDADDGTHGDSNARPSDGHVDSNDATTPVIVNAVDDNGAGSVVSASAEDGSIKWPKDGYTGKSTITYDANGRGSFPDGSTTNQVTTKYDAYGKVVTKYAHSDNVSDDGTQNGGYGNSQSYSRVVMIDNAESLTVSLTYETESIDYDWVCAYAGNGVGDAQCSTSGSLTGKLGGQTRITKSFTVNGDSVTFWFRSDAATDNYYGFHATVNGITGSKSIVAGSYAQPGDSTLEYDFNGWNTAPDGSGVGLGSMGVNAPSDLTVHAQWSKLNWSTWGTIQWVITNDGTLRIRMVVRMTGMA